MKQLLQNMKKKWYWSFCILFIVAEAFFFLLLGENIYMSAHDNMELHVLDYHLLRIYDLFFSHQATVPILHGVSRDLFFSEFSIYSFLYMIFPAAYAYETGLVLKTILGVLFCVLLAKDILKEKYARYECVVVLCSLAYGILPLYPMFSIYFISLPLVLLILRKIWYTGDWRWYVGLFFYPLLSYFAFFGFFILAYLLIVTLVQWLRKKKESRRLLLALVILSAGYVIWEYRLFYEMLFENTDSIRNSFEIQFVSGHMLLATIWEAFSKSIFHAESLQTWFVMPLCFVTCLVGMIQNIRKKTLSRIWKDPLNQVLVLIFMNSVIYGIYYFEPVNRLFETILPMLKGFQFNRTLFFNPFLWYVALLMVTIKIWNQGQIAGKISGQAVSKGICLIALLVIVVSNTRYNDIYHNIYNYAYRVIKGQESNNLTFREFFSEDLFTQVKEDIDYQGEYAVAYGMEPGILSYHKIATLDGVLSYYPQAYKDAFRQVIAPALERCDYYREYYDEWGARAYIFPGQNEQIYSPVRNLQITDRNLYIDVDAFHSLGGKYIFSRFEITNAQELSLELQGIYSDDESPYQIYVYS